MTLSYAIERPYRKCNAKDPLACPFHGLLAHPRMRAAIKAYRQPLARYDETLMHDMIMQHEKATLARTAEYFQEELGYESIEEAAAGILAGEIPNDVLAKALLWADLTVVRFRK